MLREVLRIYKTLDLIRCLKKEGALVKVVMTSSAKAFISPLCFQAVSHEKVYSDLLSYEEESAMGHINLGKWADLLLIVPASANLLQD